LHEDALSTWEGVALWDPGGKPPRERTLELKGPVEAMNIAAGVKASTALDSMTCTKVELVASE